MSMSAARLAVGHSELWLIQANYDLDALVGVSDVEILVPYYDKI